MPDSALLSEQQDIKSDSILYMVFRNAGKQLKGGGGGGLVRKVASFQEANNAAYAWLVSTGKSNICEEKGVGGQGRGHVCGARPRAAAHPTSVKCSIQTFQQVLSTQLAPSYYLFPSKTNSQMEAAGRKWM